MVSYAMAVSAIVTAVVIAFALVPGLRRRRPDVHRHSVVALKWGVAVLCLNLAIAIIGGQGLGDASPVEVGLVFGVLFAMWATTIVFAVCWCIRAAQRALDTST
jgi:hypothetical protein